MIRLRRSGGQQDRQGPGLPMKKGRGATMTHDCRRHGTTTLNVLDGTVIGRNKQRHRHQAFIRLLNAWTFHFTPTSGSRAGLLTCAASRMDRSSS